MADFQYMTNSHLTLTVHSTVYTEGRAVVS